MLDLGWTKWLLVLFFLFGVWGHGYYAAYQYWDKWYDKEVLEQNEINKKAYDRGLEDAKRLEQEEQEDADKLKQNEQESQNDPNRDAPALSSDSVQRLKRL
jgi:hypothetical protein